MTQPIFRKLFFIGVTALMFDACVSPGTHLERSEILQKPYKIWTEDECRLMMESHSSSNILDRAASFNMVVIPCTPNFLLAYNCYRWKKHLCTENEFLDNTQRQARNCFGGSFDENSGRFVNAKGKYIRDISQLDSLLVTIAVENANNFTNLTSFFSQLWKLGGVASDFYDLFPDVTQMETKISFRANGKILARPQYVRGSDATFLTKEEGYAAMFYLDENLKQYIREHESVDLYLNLRDHPVILSVRFPM